MKFYFFFSSRRRHTRFKCDWSSDVCSSDLLRAVARRAVHRVDACAPRCVAVTVRCMGRRFHPAKSVGPRPPRAESADDCVDLLVGEHSTGALRKRRHGRSLDPFADDATDGGILGDGKVQRIGERERSSTPSLRALAAGAIGVVEAGERSHLVGPRHLRVRRRLTRQRAIANSAARDDDGQDSDEARFAFHRSSSFPGSCSRPAASMPARSASGRPCQDRTRTCLETTIPATSPNPTCETTNQTQSTRWLSTGLTIPMMLCSRPVHRTGAASPASRMGRPGNMGSIAPYRIPTNIEAVRWIATATANELAWKWPSWAVDSVTALGKKPADKRLIGYQMP